MQARSKKRYGWKKKKELVTANPHCCALKSYLSHCWARTVGFSHTPKPKGQAALATYRLGPSRVNELSVEYLCPSSSSAIFASLYMTPHYSHSRSVDSVSSNP